MAYAGGAQKVATAIKTLIQTVPGTANVFDYMPLAKGWKAFLTQFQDGNRVLGWTVERKNTKNEWLDSHKNLWTHTMLIRGYLGVEETSLTGKTFTGMIDDVVNKFDGEATLLGTVEEHQPANVRIQEHRTFGGVLVHYCEIDIVCQERITRLPGGGS